MDGNSNNRVEEGNFSQSDTGADFSTLPEACIVYILALTSPPDVCRMWAVAQWLLPAVEWDALWLRFLPDDYQQILARSAESPSLSDSSSKKELFVRLCDSPLLIDRGKKMFWLEKRSGKKCFMLSARDLTIIWGFSPKYWRWFSVPESRFSEIAYLNDVCWLEIRGRINACMLSPITNYAAYLVFKLWKTISYGFEGVVVNSSIKIGDETTARRSYLKRRRRHSAEEGIPYPTQRKDGWLEIELGEFLSKGGEDIGVKITQLSNQWKRGLMVEGIEIRPKDNL
ncbi:putative F-box protein PP2-B12 [Vitis riparia]|uniref:putative F-box protein PP2-B12 n=1 Tax=Vitis riparia TaxID=96939 RepID=UPI00155B0870|nr:putative F-box protein PP2-B12 [Vitis riparia]